ncbi:MAG: hypothetical protein QM606_08600 [Leucobacter sp.]
MVLLVPDLVGEGLGARLELLLGGDEQLGQGLQLRDDLVVVVDLAPHVHDGEGEQQRLEIEVLSGGGIGAVVGEVDVGEPRDGGVGLRGEAEDRGALPLREFDGGDGFLGGARDGRGRRRWSPGRGGRCRC